MKKVVYYTYLGTNGTITSPVHLEDIYYTRKIRLVADKGCQLKDQNGNFYYEVMIPEEELDKYTEVRNGQ